MKFNNLIIVLVVVVLSLNKQSYYGAEGRKISLSREEDLELERELMILNKPPVKTIRTEFGDLFDCIDMYKQPAFDHPLLKNHKIQVKPDFIPEGAINDAASSDDTRVARTVLELHSERCPLGTVPIRRTQKEELVNAKYLSKWNTKNSLAPWPHQNFRSIRPNEDGHYGGRAVMSIYNPKVKQDQWSTAQIWIHNSTGESSNSIQVGWAVHPMLFNDTQTRLFGYWTADDFKTGCYNMLCSGFVQIHPTVALGDVLIHTLGPTRFVLDTLVYWDSNSGNWWLALGRNPPEAPAKIGYWPKELFTHLSGKIRSVRYGGLVSAYDDKPSPQMGNGILPDNDFKKASYMRNLKVVNEVGVLIDFKDIRPKEAFTSDCFGIRFYGYIDKFYELGMSFGGPGGDCW